MKELDELYSMLRNEKLDNEKQKVRWNERAMEFSRRGNHKLNEECMDFIAEHFEFKNRKVLDIGFGSGRYMLQLLQRGAKVSGVELSDEMMRYACEMLKENGYDCKKLALYNAAWEDIDIDKLSLRSAFDLVFMSNTPVVSNADSLKKALACSKGDVYIATHLMRTDDVIEFLHEKYHGEKRNYQRDEFEVLKRVLCAEGYRVYDKVLEHHREISSDIKVVFNRYDHWLFGLESSEEEKKWLLRELDALSVNGEITAHSTFITGIIYGKRYQ